MPTRTHLAMGLALASLFASSASAQNLVGIDGVTGDVIVFSGAPAGPCATPTGPIQLQFSTLPIVEPCNLPKPPGAAGTTDIGGIAVKLKGGEYFTAGLDLLNGNGMLGLFDTAGTAIAGDDIQAWGYANVTGMAYDLSGATEDMYFTDGTKVGKFGAGLICGGFPALDFSFSFTPFAGPGVLTGLDYDSAGDTMWACTSAGEVIHFDTSGNTISSFTSTFTGTHLTGIALDGASGKLFVTDGTWVMEYDQAGNPGPNPFWWPSVIEVAPGSLVGLDWVPAGVNFGAGANTAGGMAPHLSTPSYSYLGNTSFSLEVTGGAPMTPYVLYWSLGNLCPPIPVAGLPLQLAAPFQSLATKLSDGAGDTQFPLPLPPVPSLTGLPIFTQVVGFPSSGALEITEGLALTLSGV
jgi:hypothetical protein